MRTLLLDTCALLWWMDDSAHLGAGARRAIANRRNTILVSAASLWEIAIKRRRGRLAGVDAYLAGHAQLHVRWGFSTIVIEPADAVAAGLLPLPVDDPFDRMLIAQSRRVRASIVTSDDAISVHATCVW